ncbi:unnamed protein product [Prorocentrum cordatum]|uniref:Probable beta-glucosidase G n=1 Tax=Prorocentrum cordatum TaxID=2364126 RepID=A0ABN9QDY7_9DINO|nr:unnamed protein product [Polarella glacialis]
MALGPVVSWPGRAPPRRGPADHQWALLGCVVVLALACVLGVARLFRSMHVGGTASDEWLPRGYCEERSAIDMLDVPASDLVTEMTFLEKARLVAGVGWPTFARPDEGYYVGNVLAIPRWLASPGIPSIKMQDAAQGWRTNRRQVGQVTAWPCSLAVAATWSRDTTKAWAARLGLEFRMKGANVVLGPAVNVHRTPFNGRNAEYLSGEDPALGAALARMYVQGVQDDAGVAAVVKHFEGNQQETSRVDTNTIVDERTRWELYYPPFQAAVEAGAAAVMCAYNNINGRPACENPELLKVDLKERMGFGGWVMSDWWAFKSANSTRSGADMEMPGAPVHSFWAPEALEALPQAELDDMAARVLGGMSRFWRRDQDGCRAGCNCDGELYRTGATSLEHVEFARRIATESAVLLKNDAPPVRQGGDSPSTGLLPLRGIKALAVVGEACDAQRDVDWYFDNWTRGDYYTVGGSGRVLSDKVSTVLGGLLARRPAGLEVIGSASDSLPEALQAMEGVDAVVVCGGATSSESFDRGTLRLDQEGFVLRAVAAAVAAGLPSVVVAMVPGAVTAPWSHNATAALALFLGGQEAGNAVSPILLGNAFPSGKLPVTFPSREKDAIRPCMGRKDFRCTYSEGLMGGWHAYDGKPVDFPFGHGLGYTEFEYEKGTVTSEKACKNSTDRVCSGVRIIVRVEVSNSGSMQGAEVVQLYVGFPSGLGEPALVLRDFQKTPALAPGWRAPKTAAALNSRRSAPIQAT